jgi:guanine deaminase
LVCNGTTTALVFGTVHPQSVNAFFEQAESRNLRMICGKVLMDRNCPEDLRDSDSTGYYDSKALIEKWHGRGRLSYAITPRFAPTSSPSQLASAAILLKEYPDVYLHTHLAENQNECRWVKELFPESEDYLAVYENAGLVRKRSVFAHGIHLCERELKALAANDAALAHCPTSNLFLGSGLFDMEACEKHKVKVGMGTDVGAGSCFSVMHSYNEAYKVQQLQGKRLSVFKGLYLATLGGARALDLEGTVGNFMPGCEADFVLLDQAATPFLKFRMQQAHTLLERLFALMMLGDDRCVQWTYIMGELVYQRDAAQPYNYPNLQEAKL